MESLKDTQRLQYDYFKHLTTLSVTSIGLLIAAIRSDTLSYSLIPAGLSIFSLLICLITALFAMPVATNSILFLTGVRITATSKVKKPEESRKDFDEFAAKYTGTLDRIRSSDRLTRITFLAGVLAALVYAGLKLLE
jgi:hypothetical protein